MPLPTSDRPEELRDEAFSKLKEASEALKEYKLTGEQFDLPTARKLDRRILEFIKEAMAVGGSGEPCSRCGGSGREPG